jgi:hypothetical protein
LNRYARSAVCLLGLAIIVGTACWYSEATPFPGVAAALPSAGAMLVVWQGRHLPAQRLLGNPVAVWLGRISYSTYLIHWPIVVFWLYLSIEPPTLTVKFLLLASCILGGQLLYSLVERRFRYAPAGQQSPRLPFRAGLAAAAGVIALGCSVVLATNGLPGRMAPDVAEYRRQSLFEFLRDYGDGILALGPKGGPRVLIFGDSMVQNYVPAILRAHGFRDARVDIVSRGGCVMAKDAVLVNYGSPDAQCLTLRDHLYALKGPYDVVIWAQNWMGYGNSLHWQDAGGAIEPAFAGGADFAGWHTGIERTLDHFGALAKRIVLIGPPITVSNVQSILTRIGPLTNIAAIPQHFSDMRELSSARRDTMDGKLRDLAAHKPGVLYVDPRAIICMGGKCRLWQGRYSFFMDGVHYAAAATEMLRKGLQCQGLVLPGQ